MNRTMRNVLLSLLLLIIVLGFWQCELVNYGLMQGRGQLRVLWNARPVEEVLKDPAVPDSLKEKLFLVREVREFAEDSLGIRRTDNYTTIFDQQGQDILWVVTAVEPYSLEQKEWRFPIVGTVSYKGFFDYERALQEEAALKDEGYDTYMRSVGAWSTLGWFKDPIMSKLLFRGEGQLINTIIHELTHGTIFVKDSLDFNENLATFIGHEGALRFMASKWGEDSELLEKYRENYEGKHLFSEHMLRGLKHLEELYGSFTEETPLREKELAKQKLISRVIQQTDTLPVKNAEGYKKILEKIEPNNAYFMSYERYRGTQTMLQDQLERQFNGNLSAFLAFYKRRHGVND